MRYKKTQKNSIAQVRTRQGFWAALPMTSAGRKRHKSRLQVECELAFESPYLPFACYIAFFFFFFFLSYAMSAGASWLGYMK